MKHIFYSQRTMIFATVFTHQETGGICVGKDLGKMDGVDSKKLE